MPLKLETRVKNHLLKYGQSFGRTGLAMSRLAHRSKVSVSMLQSVMLGRRNFSDSAAARVEKALARERELWAKLG